MILPFIFPLGCDGEDSAQAHSGEDISSTPRILVKSRLIETTS
jgi:hypothetical protein